MAASHYGGRTSDETQPESRGKTKAKVIWDIVVHDAISPTQKLVDDKDKNKTIMILSTIVQTKEYLVVMVQSESPNSILHDILIHMVVGAEAEDSTEVKVVDTTTTLDSMEEKIFKDADISPRAVKAIKSSRKRKKQGNEEAAQLVRVQSRGRPPSISQKVNESSNTKY
ncbi:hypothetical protein HAX54_024542 [Datura stramonium]|uniref:Uncharacterized protein n=1 Tax=Datura stramonium TaxID=4076 RepID=A0ABS8S5T7_DATST|nr:hypothetical protein [Datura stramonium]